MQTSTIQHRGIRRLSDDKLEAIYDSAYEFTKGIVSSEMEGHLQHIIGNQATVINTLAYFPDRFSDKECKSALISTLRNFRDYTKLLQENPEYHRQELENEFGAFPEVLAEGDNGIRKYIQHSIKELSKF